MLLKLISLLQRKKIHHPLPGGGLYWKKVPIQDFHGKTFQWFSVFGSHW
jgi:hypothetical protein